MDTKWKPHTTEIRHYLKEWRLKRGLLQGELAKRVGVATSVISRYETGDRRIHLEMQFRLMQALGVYPAQFFSDPNDSDLNELDAIVVAATPEERRKLVKMAKLVLGKDDGDK
jgi:transcriptional regulator with XRE-family HTH domain